MTNGMGDGFRGGRCSRTPRPKSFQGGYWGYALWPGGCYLTRTPDFHKACGWFDSYTDPDSSNAKLLRHGWNVYHQTDHVLVPQLTDGGTTYRCVGVASSTYANGSGMKGLQPSVVWYQLDFAPLNDLGTKTPRAGFARVQVCDNTSAAQEGDPFNHQATLLDCWLCEPGTRWDAPEKLGGYYQNGETIRRTLVGPSYFVWEERTRTVGGTNQITYWPSGAATPTVKTWTNPEVISSEVSDWRCALLDVASFPMGLATQVEVTSTHGDGSIASARRRVRVGQINLGTMLLDTTDIESNNDTINNALESGRGAQGELSFSRTSDAPPASIGVLNTYFNDLAIQMQYKLPLPNPINPAAPFHLFRHAPIFGVSPPSFDDYETSPRAWQAVVVYNQRVDDDWLGNSSPAPLTLNTTSHPTLGSIKTIGGWYAVESPYLTGDSDVDGPWDSRHFDADPSKRIVRCFAGKHNTAWRFQGFIRSGFENPIFHGSTRHAMDPGTVPSGEDQIPPAPTPDVDSDRHNHQWTTYPFQWFIDDAAPEERALTVRAVGGAPGRIEPQPRDEGGSDYLPGPQWDAAAFGPSQTTGVAESGRTMHHLVLSTNSSSTGSVAPLSTTSVPVVQSGTACGCACPGGQRTVSPRFRGPVPPPVGAWWDTSGVRRYSGTLCYDASYDDLHPDGDVWGL